uniref:Uncharacterized protein n=1 Tax=Setaria italica TaxID=4555 RepID=K3YKN0_SETIT
MERTDNRINTITCTLMLTYYGCNNGSTTHLYTALASVYADNRNNGGGGRLMTPLFPLLHKWCTMQMI